MVTEFHAGLIKAQGFDQAFDNLRQDIRFRNGEQAFEHLNKAYREAFGVDRYASYSSYKSSRSQRDNSNSY